MIRVDGQFALKFKINDIEDFLEPEDLVNFVIIEDAGNILPTFQLIFVLRDVTLLSVLNEGNSILASLGPTPQELIEIDLNIVRVILSRAGTGAYTISVVGNLNHIPYITTENVWTTAKKPASEVMKEIIERNNFSFETNLSTTSKDVMNWVQYNITDKRFLSQLWMHMYLPNTFPAIGITMEGIFRVYDVLKKVKEKEDWILTYDQDSNDDCAQFKTKGFVPEGDYEISIDSGFLNHWVGYGRKTLVGNLETGASSLIKENMHPILGESDSLLRNNEIPSRISRYQVSGDNVHDKYWECYNHNLSYLVLSSVTKATITYSRHYCPVKVLDVLLFKDDEIESNQSQENISGKYVITKVARTLTKLNISTSLGMVKDTFNDTKGNLR